MFYMYLFMYVGLGGWFVSKFALMDTDIFKKITNNITQCIGVHKILTTY